jgi:type IV secretion system protein VirD4
MTRKQQLITASVLVYLIAAYFAAQYLAGLIYFLANKSLPHELTTGTWFNYWHFYARDPIQGKRLEFSLGCSLIALLGAPLLILNAIYHKERSLHGEARFATNSELAREKLFGEEGLIIGRMGGRYLTLPGQTFVLIAAPTRQGKGAGVVVPNLLHYPDSVVVLDIKLENFQLTSLFRQRHGQKVFLFNPFAEDGRTHRWNPMDAIRRDPALRIVDVLALGEKLYPRRDDDSGMWNDLARDLFMGLTLYLLETPGMLCSFGEVLRQSSGKGRAIKEHIQQILQARRQGEGALSDTCFDALSRFCNSQERTLSSIVNTFTAALTLFVNPHVDAATSATDFDVGRVRKERMSIYVGIPANRMESASVIVNLFFAHLINENMGELPEQNPQLKYACLVLMDEFTMLGRVGIIAKSIGAMAQYNLRLMPVIQGTSQLIGVYGENDARTIQDNCALQILYPPRGQEDAQEYSDMLGTYTAKARSTGLSTPRAALAAGNTGSASENISDQRRVLMLPQELRKLPFVSEIIIKAGIDPILCDKAFYFTDELFINRLKALSPTLAKIKGLPSEAQLKYAALTLRELSIELPRYDLGLHVARVEKRTRALRPGEAIDVSRLAVDRGKLPELSLIEEATPESVGRQVNSFLDSLEPGSALETELPLREPERPELMAMEAAASRLPSPEGLLRLQHTRPATTPVAGPLRRRLGVIDLDALKRAAERRDAASG